ncbi:MAG: integrase core domain-containing protein [Rhodoplanes sp.]
MGIRDRPISPSSPWQNPYAERLIGTLRRDCLDHVLIFGARHLRQVLTAYSCYYDQTRTHCRWTRTFRSAELSSNMGPSLPCRFCQGCIIATRGYDFRERQVTRTSAYPPIAIRSRPARIGSMHLYGATSPVF